jgi:cellulose synthase operon protein C
LSLLITVFTLSGAAWAQDDNAKVDPAAKKLAAAGGLFHQGLFKMAGETYGEFIERYPDHADISAARFGLAISRYRIGGALRVKDPAAAAKEYQVASRELVLVAADEKFEQGDQALEVLGHCQLSLKACDKALAAFEQLIKRYPKSPRVESVTLSKAQTLYMLGKFAPSRDACAAFLKTYPKSPSLMTAQYFMALSLKSLKQYAQAAETLDKLLETPNCPYQIDALLLLGQCQQSTGKLDLAEAAYRKMIKTGPPNRQVDARYSLAVVLYEAGKFAEAVKECKAVLGDKNSRYAEAARFQLGLSQWAAGDVSAARSTFQQVVKQDASRKSHAAYWLARCDMADKKFDIARKTLTELHASGKGIPNAEQVSYDIAVCSMSLDKYQQGAADFEAYRKAFPKGPKLVDTLYRQAFCLHKLAKYDACEKLCRQVIAAGDSPVKQAAAELAAESLFLDGKYAAAEKELTELAKLAKDEVSKLRFAVRIGQCAFFAGDYKRAAELLGGPVADKRVAGDAALREAILILGDARLRTDQFAGAAEAFAKYLSVSNKNLDEAKYKLAVSNLRASKKSDAAKAFLTVIGGDVSSPWVLRSLFEYGQMMYHDGQSVRAATALKKVMDAKAPAELAAGATYLIAWIDFDAKKYAPAAKKFAQMVEKYPNHKLAKDAAFQQALCMQLDKKLPEALAGFQAFAKAYPSDKRAAEANRMAAQCLTGMDKHAEAMKLLTALADDPKTVSDEVLYELAWSQREANAVDPAIVSYRKLISEYPKTAKLIAARAELADLLYDKKKQYKEAAELLTAVLADKSADAKTMSVSHYRLGWCYQKTGDTVNEAKIFADFATKYPKDPAAASALYQAGAAYTKLSKWDLAAGQFETLLKSFAKHELAPQSYIQLAQVQSQAGKLDESRKSYQAFLEKNAKHKLAYLAKFGIGWSYESQKKYDEARKWYSAVEESHNGPTAARAKFQIGETYFAEEKYERAARELIAVDAVYAYPEWSARALLEAGRALDAGGQKDLARKQYEACVKKYPKSKSAEVAAERMKAIE